MMNKKHKKFSPIQLLSKSDEEKIHDATIKVLEKTGVSIKSQEFRQLLTDAGCRVSDLSGNVLFPEELVMKSLDAAPKSFIGKAVDNSKNVTFDSDSMLFIPGCGMKTFDLDTWETREPTRKEFYDNIRVLDQLENVDMQNCFPYFGFSRTPECMKLLESTAAKFRMSGKAQIEGSIKDNYRWNIAMAKAVDADLFQLVNSAAPLTYFDEITDQIKYYVEQEMPFHFSPGPTRGLTCPATIAGSLVSNNAESLAGIVMAQIIRPGSRVWVNSMIMTPDMSTGSPAFGDIGNALTDSGFCQMWRRYGIPSWVNCASWTSSKMIDYQSGYEMTMNAVIMALSGASAISFQGGLNAELSVHPVKSIIDNDVIGMIKRFLEGIEVSDETMAVDLINEVGSIPGSFLDSDHTFEWWRNECYIPKYSDRTSYEVWAQSGKKSALDIAREKYESMTESYPVNLLTDHQEKEIEYILNDARKYYKDKGYISEEEWEIYQEDINSPAYPFA